MSYSYTELCHRYSFETSRRNARKVYGSNTIKKPCAFGKLKMSVRPIVPANTLRYGKKACESRNDVPCKTNSHKVENEGHSQNPQQRAMFHGESTYSQRNSKACAKFSYVPRPETSRQALAGQIWATRRSSRCWKLKHIPTHVYAFIRSFIVSRRNRKKTLWHCNLSLIERDKESCCRCWGATIVEISCPRAEHLT
jgi:hypothetical protein